MVFLVYPSHALNAIMNLRMDSLWSRFQVVSFHESIITQQQDNIKYIKGPIDFVNCSSDELQSRCEMAGPKIVEYLIQVESKMLKRYQPKWHP